LVALTRNGIRTGFLGATSPVLQTKAGMQGRAARGGPIQRPKPYPYQTKRYGVLNAFFDKTSWRFDENSKIIVVEGPMACGKSSFAKDLAEDLDMLHLKAVTMDDVYVNPYGYDLRQLDDKLPPGAKSFDEKKFLQDPTHRNTLSLQTYFLELKFSQYVDAVCHLMNTGQGVVIERSCFSVFVFAEALYSSKFINKRGLGFYNTVLRHSVPFVLKPHMIIYLDVPVSKVQENIKKRNLPHEVNSKALTTKFLTDIERKYKDAFLPDMRFVYGNLLFNLISF